MKTSGPVYTEGQSHLAQCYNVYRPKEKVSSAPPSEWFYSLNAPHRVRAALSFALKSFSNVTLLTRPA